MNTPQTFCPPTRTLLGPGPSDAPASVLAAMNQPLIGHLDPAFINMMEEIKAMLRNVFLTNNEMTFPISGTGSAGMEFCFVNLIEPGDEVIVGINGVFGMRMADVATRCGAKVTKVESEWGDIIEADQIETALKENPDTKLVAIVHAETSTGALTPVEEISKLVHSAGALLLIDTVTSLGGCPVRIDDWEVDAVYSGTQKCLSCPPGLSPVSLSDRAMDKIKGRKTTVQSWYLDVNLLANYWGDGARVYHHTAPIAMNYALHESLRLILEEGLENRWKRHESNHLRLKAGLGKLGLKLTAREGYRLWQLNAIGVPEQADEAYVRTSLLNDHNIEIGPGLGPLQGKVWRVGLMGESSTEEKVDRFLNALESLL